MCLHHSMDSETVYKQIKRCSAGCLAMREHGAGPFGVLPALAETLVTC